jgi:hypothetical protein
MMSFLRLRANVTPIRSVIASAKSGLQVGEGSAHEGAEIFPTGLHHMRQE